MDYYQRSIDAAAEVRAHPRFGKHPEVLAKLDEYEKDRKKWKVRHCETAGKTHVQLL